MKIALLTDGIYPYVIGGMQKHSFYLAKYLAKNQIYVDLYHTNQSQFDIHKLEFFTEEEKKYIHSFVVDFPKHKKIPGHYIRESYEYSKQIYTVFKNNSTVDFIYVQGFC
ncbi:MAG TPA: glycosyltransferase family 1 protein, partial [Bacteroidia bacterium]|nr:glycosyltransferase family 1 protein [Bacteroidia bacterium]